MKNPTDITVTVSKTMQEKQFEPLKIEVSVTKEVPLTEVDNEIRQTYEQVEEHIDELFQARLNK